MAVGVIGDVGGVNGVDGVDVVRGREIKGGDDVVS